MSSILSNAARASLYPQNDGSGRDTYISFNNGGNTILYVPDAKHIKMGPLIEKSLSY